MLLQIVSFYELFSYKQLKMKLKLILIALLLITGIAQAQVRQTGGISFTPQWNYKISGSDTTWQFGNTLMSPTQFPYLLTKWQSDQRYAPKANGYVQFGTTTSLTNYIPFLNDSNRVVVNLSGLRYLSASNRYLSGIRADFTNGLRSSLAPTTGLEVLRLADSAIYAKSQVYAPDTLYKGNGTTTLVKSNITDDGSYIKLDAKTGGQVELDFNGNQKVVVDDNTTYVFNDLNVTSLNTGTPLDDIVVSNGGLIKKIPGNTYQKQFIVNVGDYVTDTTGTVDVTAGVKAAFAAIPLNGGTIFFPGGMYLISDSIIVNKKVTIMGSSYTYIKFASGTANTAFHFTANAASSTIRDIRIFNKSASTPISGNGFYFEDASHVLIDHVQIESFYNGININGGNVYNIKNNYIANNAKYQIFIRNLAAPDAGDSNIEGNFIESGQFANSEGIHQESGGGLKIIGNKFNLSGANEYKYGINLNITNTTSILIVNGNSIEGYKENAIRITNQSGTQFGYINVAHNEFGAFSGVNKNSVYIKANTPNDIYNVIVSDNNGHFNAPANYSFIKIDGILDAFLSNNLPNVGIVDSVVNSTNIKRSIETITTTGSSGAASISVHNLNVPAYTAAGLGAYPTSGGSVGGPVSASDVVTSSGGQIRAGGWVDASNGYQGPAMEIGYTGGNAAMVAYDRSTSSYKPGVINGNSWSIISQAGDISLTPTGGDVKVPTKSPNNNSTAAASTNYVDVAVAHTPTVVASYQLAGKTNVGAILSYTPPVDGFYLVNGVFFVNSITTNTLRAKVSVTTPSGTSATQVSAVATAATNPSTSIGTAFQLFVYAKGGTAITLEMENPVSVGSQNYDLAARLTYQPQ